MTAAEPDLFDYAAELERQRETVAAVADTPPYLTDPEFALFVSALREDAYRHGGFVTQNRVRKAMSNDKGLSINSRRYSAFWPKAERLGLIRFQCKEPNRDHKGRNLGKESKVYRWQEVVAC